MSLIVSLLVNKVNHRFSSDIYRKNISLKKINNIILMLRTCIILLSSFMIYFFLYMSLGTFSYFIKKFLLTADIR